MTAGPSRPYREYVDPFAKLARVPRRPPRSDVLAAGALLVWALLEALLNSGPGPLVGRIGFAIAITVRRALRARAPLPARTAKRWWRPPSQDVSSNAM